MRFFGRSVRRGPTWQRTAILVLGVLALSLLIAAACGETSTPTPAPEPATSVPSTAVSQPTATAVPAQVVTATAEPPTPEPEVVIRPRDEWTVENPATLAEIEAELEKHRGESIVIVGPGGAYQAAMRQSYFIPLTDRFGIEVIEDSPNKTPAQWVAAAETGNIGWDVSSSAIADSVALIKTDALEELDLSVVDIRDLLDPIQNLSPYMGGGEVTWSIVLAYNTDVYPGDSGPKTWADFFDVEKFPGRRGLRNAVGWGGQIQIARLAREPELLNSPEGKEAANTPSREQIEEDFAWFADWVDDENSDVVYWSTGSDCPQMLIAGEVDMCSAWNGRIFDAVEGEGAPIAVCWECGHIVNLSGWTMIKGIKELHPEKYELANLVTAWVTFAEINVEMSKYISYGPVNRKAIPLLDDPAFDHVRDELPTSAANAPYGIILDEIYLGEILDWAEEMYITATQ